MQDFRSIPGGSGRIFGGGGGGDGGGAADRRLRVHPHQHLKCPRCDSLNTKFCYYNNYNLSQPRHFCKSCRRYWTKGGVLRNVPVGGGCRKSKRSSTSSSSKPSKSSHESKDHNRRSSAGSRSSSDSSSLTAATTDASSITAASYNPDPSPSFDPSPAGLLLEIDQAGTAEIFPETGNFTNLISAVANPAILGVNITDQSPFRFQAEQQVHQQQQKMVLETSGMVEQQQQQQFKMEEITVGFMDQTVPMDLPPAQCRMGGGGLTGLDWPSSVDPTAGPFDLTSAVDQGWYWNQSHWGEDDPTLYLP